MRTYFEPFKYVGSFHLLPFITICYDSTICDGAISIGWLWWGVSIVTKNPLEL